MTHAGLKFGAFIGPHHRLGDNPTLALRRDIDLAEWLDHLGYDEVWFGEHHSSGWETVSSPELMIAAVAERTKRIMLGAGVVSLPYHHPLMVANRFVQLDHMTRGRVMLGVGPGALSSDAHMLGIETADQRRRMEEALGAVIRLLERREPVSMKTDWFELREATTQLAPYQSPRFDIAVASSTTPNGVIQAGRHGLGVLAIGASLPGGPQSLAKQWGIAEATAAEHGKRVDRSNFRVVVHAHVAEDDERAVREIRNGEAAESAYYTNDLGRPASSSKTPLDDAVAAKAYLVGSPQTVADGIRKFLEWSGGFGTFLVRAHEWATREQTFRSYELLARYVMPQFQGSLDSLVASNTWCRDNQQRLFAPNVAAVRNAFAAAGQEAPKNLRTFGGST